MTSYKDIPRKPGTFIFFPNFTKVLMMGIFAILSSISLLIRTHFSIKLRINLQFHYKFNLLIYHNFIVG